MSLCPCCRQKLPIFDDLIIDESGILVRNGQFAVLTQKELEIFRLLASEPGKVRTKQKILSSVYWRGSDDEEPEIKIIDVFICKLRKKLALLDIEIQTIWGSGYRFVPVAAKRKAA